MSWSLQEALAIGAALCCLVALGCGADPCDERRPGTVCQVIGTGDLGFNQDGQPAEQTDLFLVSSARRGPDGLIYVADFNNWRIRRIGENGRVETVAGNGIHGSAIAGLPATESPIDNPFEIDFTPDGRLVTVSFEDPRLLAIDNDGIVRVLAGAEEPGFLGNEGDGEDASAARFLALEGVLVAPDGTIYLSDSEAHRVRVIEDGIITTLAGTGTPGHSGDGGPAADAELVMPTAMALDADGNLYVADSGSHVVRRISPGGIIDTVAGTGERGLTGDEGPATMARLNEPYGLAVADDGTLYIADRSNFRIRAVGPDGIIDTVAGTDEGYSGDGGPALEAKFGFLARIALDGDSLLISDQSNGAVRRLHLEPDEP